MIITPKPRRPLPPFHVLLAPSVLLPMYQRQFVQMSYRLVECYTISPKYLHEAEKLYRLSAFVTENSHRKLLSSNLWQVPFIVFCGKQFTSWWLTINNEQHLRQENQHAITKMNWDWSLCVYEVKQSVHFDLKRDLVAYIAGKSIIIRKIFPLFTSKWRLTFEPMKNRPKHWNHVGVKVSRCTLPQCLAFVSKKHLQTGETAFVNSTTQYLHSVKVSNFKEVRNLWNSICSFPCTISRREVRKRLLYRLNHHGWRRTRRTAALRCCWKIVLCQER